MAYRIGKCLLSIRLREAGMTQVELADRLGVPRQQVSRWARNEQGMSLESAKNVAVILDCHIDDLYDWVFSRNRK